MIRSADLQNNTNKWRSSDDPQFYWTYWNHLKLAFYAITPDILLHDHFALTAACSRRAPALQPLLPFWEELSEMCISAYVHLKNKWTLSLCGPCKRVPRGSWFIRVVWHRKMWGALFLVSFFKMRLCTCANLKNGKKPTTDCGCLTALSQKGSVVKSVLQGMDDQFVPDQRKPGNHLIQVSPRKVQHVSTFQMEWFLPAEHALLISLLHRESRP